ncbi:MAG: serine hydrolase [Leptospiraceae bacterium]|nr:serine hydrolase [Leptospiraceae bacterium]
MKQSQPALYSLLSALLISLVFGTACKDGSRNTASGRLDIEELEPVSSWPAAAWPESKPEAEGMDTAALQKLAEYTFQKTGPDSERKGIRSDALVIIRNGKLVYEKYDRNYTKDSRHLIWSISKSFVNALYGIAVQEGRLKIDYPAAQYYKALDTSDKRSMTLRHILNMSSGIYWQEDYEYAPLKSSVVAMLYTRGRDDMAAFTARQEMRTEPGQYLYYSSGDSNLLMGILKNVLKAEYDEYPWQKLFAVLGMQTAVWERDASGTFVGSSYIYCSARDLARFGYLYLADGIWQNRRLLPEGWVDFTRTPAPAHTTTLDNDELLEYQMTAQWYSNLDIPNSRYSAPWPDAPRDTFAGLGHWGQRLFVIPSLNMIVVRFGDDRDGSFNINTFLKLVKDSVQQ